MNAPVIPLKPVAAPSRERRRERPRGRPVLPWALADVQAALGALPLRRDLLIEHLHALQDRYRQLTTAHLAALAQLLRLSQAEVFEVASCVGVRPSRHMTLSATPLPSEAMPKGFTPQVVQKRCRMRPGPKR